MTHSDLIYLRKVFAHSFKITDELLKTDYSFDGVHVSTSPNDRLSVGLLLSALRENEEDVQEENGQC